ncbi:GIY-YIG nuclease family protein [Bermanella sp. R86510]|uniref:GIY-YIG nuclease family protein n=1 Tax=unclassified Bermanella TaxID=2627862 RepID=UPI0037C735F5
MLVFTITNHVTDEVWVGTCKDSSDERFAQFQEAMALGIKHQFYKDLEDFGVQNFTVEDYAVATDRDELRDIVDEALETYDGKSLVGVKTTLGKTSIATAAPLRSSVKKAKETSAKRTVASTSKVAGPAIKKESLPTGRTSAKKEKLIKEKIAQEKADRESKKAKKIMEEADEMAAIMAKLDSRGSSLKKR